MRWALFLALACCGRMDFDVLPASPTDSQVTGDAPLGDCRWDAPRPITELNTNREESEPALHPDGTTLVFASDRNGGTDRLYTSTRSQSGWSAPTVISALNSGSGDGGPSWNAAGTRLYFSSFRSGPLRLYEVSFANGAFGEPVRVAGLESLVESLAPTVRGDELEMFFSSRLSPSRIEYATRPTRTSAWTPMGNVPELVDSLEHGYPGITSDGLTLYFEIQRPGGFFIGRTTRESLTQPFGPISPVTELDATGSHGDPAPSFDGGLMLFASDRMNPGDFDIYISTRLCGS